MSRGIESFPVKSAPKWNRNWNRKGMKLEPLKRLTDLNLRSLLKSRRTGEGLIPDGSVPGLSIRLFPGGAANWSFLVRVAGEGGVNNHGKRLLGKKLRISLGNYPEVSLQAARARANHMADQAKHGVNPKELLKESATAGSLTIADLSEEFLKQYVYSKELDSARKYELAFRTHINPDVGERLAELLTREEVRKVMEAARIKRQRAPGMRGGGLGGVEAARTAMGVLRHMYSWAMEEGKLKRKDNPASKIEKNLPKKKQGDVVLSLTEARLVWDAAEMTGYPFGTHVQLMLLTGCRLDEWASVRTEWIDMSESVMVIPAGEYKTDHVHIVPLVPQALELLKRIPKPQKGDYLLSSTGGRVPIQGIPKYFNTRLADAIIALTGAKFSKSFSSHDLRRTVATRLAENLGDQGDKLVKRVLGHSDGSVTAIYNRYAYVREMRRVLEVWANDLTARPTPLQSFSEPTGTSQAA
jgi:integrase